MTQWIRWLQGLSLVLLIWVLAAPGAAGDGVRRFISGVEAYQRGDYATAIADFSGLVQSGATNPKLYYNLGNAYLKQGDLGRAVLWYEKALKYMPNDPDLRFNLDYARSLTKDVREATSLSLFRILFFWKYQLSTRTILFVALGGNLIFWILAGAYRLTRRKTLKAVALVVLVPAIVLVFTAGFNYLETVRFQQAVILPDTVSVRAGLEETSTALFELHAGAKVSVLKQLKDHYQVRFSEDKLGWVAMDDLGLL